MELSGWLGIAIAVVALFLVFKVAKTFIKVILLVAVAVGLYLAFGDRLFS